VTNQINPIKAIKIMSSAINALNPWGIENFQNLILSKRRTSGCPIIDKTADMIT
jgi:hypothetical protein